MSKTWSKALVGIVVAGWLMLSSAFAIDVPMTEQPSVGKSANRAKLHVDLGHAYLGGGRMAVALEEAGIALAADPNYAPAYNLLGLVHMFLNEPKVAEENFQKALRLAPNDPEYSNNYGWLLCQDGREKDAFPYFMVAVKNPLYQTPTKPYFNAGVCALRLKDNKLAESYFTRALETDPRNIGALYKLAELRYQAGRYYEAQRMVADVITMVDNDPAPVWLALRIERKLGNREEEVNYAKQLRSKYAGSPQHQALMQGKFE